MDNVAIIYIKPYQIHSLFEQSHNCQIIFRAPGKMLIRNFMHILSCGDGGGGAGASSFFYGKRKHVILQLHIQEKLVLFGNKIGDMQRNRVFP